MRDTTPNTATESATEAAPGCAGRFQLLRRLGTGGMGVVYEAHDPRRDRTVALKLLHPDALADGDRRARLEAQLEAEARTAAQLEHPHIGRVYGLERSERGPLLVMEYLRGETLDARLRRGPLPLADAAELLRQAASALSYAHERGVLHCDVKPANLLIAPDGDLKILDFGLARLRRIDEVARPDGPGGSGGTLDYMSPEQVRGLPVDARSDGWALAVVLYEALTGVRPFGSAGDLSATILDIISREPTPPSELRPQLPAALDELLETALAKRPADRYPDVTALAADLDALQRGAPRPGARRAPDPPVDVPVGAPADAPRAPAGGAARETRPRRPHNLPALLDRAVGRDTELAIVERYLADPSCRILSLLGPGGMGKSYLSQHVGRRQLHAPRFVDGVWFVALESLTDASQVAGAVAEALGVRLEGASTPLAQLVAHIGERRTLLILDNHEHVMAAAPLVAELVRACPKLAVLVTTRERLALEREWVLPLQGLSFPAEAPASVEEARRYGAVELFERRAQQVRPEFELTPEQLPALTRLNLVLQGLPLGIEMVAAWVRLLSLEVIARQVEHNFDLLALDAPDVPERHRSIRAVFDYSWELLDAAEREALLTLSVFRSGIALDAAAALEVSVSRMATLADRSLLQREADGRFQQHPLLQRYAAARLAADPQREAELRRRHALHFLGLLAERGQQLRGPRQKEALAALVQNSENLRAAWLWSARHGDPHDLAATAEPLRLFYDQRGLIAEGLELFRRVADELPSGSPALGHVQVNEAWLHLRASDYERAEARVTAGTARLQGGGARRTAALALNVRGALAAHQGDPEHARERFREALRTARLLGADDLIAVALDNLASVETTLGEVAAAEGHYRESLARAEAAGNHGQLVLSLNNLGNLLMQQQRFSAAEDALERGLALARETGVSRLLPFFLANLALVAEARDDLEVALQRFAEALSLIREGTERHFEAALLLEAGRLRLRCERQREAEEDALRALRLGRALDETPLLLRALLLLGECWLARGQGARAAAPLGAVAHHPDAADEQRRRAGELLAAAPAAVSGAAAGAPPPALEPLLAELLAAPP